MTTTTTYFVSQASGQQSQAVITHLLARSTPGHGIRIHALVRNLERAPSFLKHDPRIVLFEGESTDPAACAAAASGCSGAFVNTFSIPGLEAQQARTLIAACREAGTVRRLVASTTFFAGRRAVWDDDATRQIPDTLAYFESKAEVERIVREGVVPAADADPSSGMTYTILRPAVLASDFLLPGVRSNFPGLEGPRPNVLDHGCDAGTRLPFTDTADVGRYAAAALTEETDKFAGREIDLAHELLTIEEARDVLSRVSGGRDIALHRRTAIEVESAMRFDEGGVFGVRFQLWANGRDWARYEGSGGEKAGAVQSEFGIPFTSLEEAMIREKKRLMETLGG